MSILSDPYFPEKSDIMNYLSLDAKEELDSILSIDRNRTLENRILPDRFHEDEVSFTYQNRHYHCISFLTRK